VALVSGALVVLVAGPALAAACTNQSKPDGTGNHTMVLVNPVTNEVTISGFNGGWADVYVDFNLDGIADPGELVEEDVQIGRNHSPQFDDTAGPWINPGSINKALSANATQDHGMIVHFP
jgi:hypothetical protein